MFRSISAQAFQADYHDQINFQIGDEILWIIS